MIRSIIKYGCGYRIVTDTTIEIILDDEVNQWCKDNNVDETTFLSKITDVDDIKISPSKPKEKRRKTFLPTYK